MMRTTVTMFVAAACLVPSGRAQAADTSRDDRRGAMELRADHYDVSPPLSELIAAERGRAKAYEDKEETFRPKQWDLSPPQDLREDGALHGRAPLPDVTVTNGLNFDGVGVPNITVNVAPPDTNGSVGRTIGGVGYYVQWVNLQFAVYNKATGALVAGPTNGNVIWSGFPGVCSTTNNGDPIVLYDKMADRWVLMQFAVSSQPYTQCVAVSQGTNPLGPYNRYAFTYGNQFNDYPKVGVWPDGYYVTYNMFANGSSFSGGWVCAMDRVKMLAGQAATQQCFNLGTSFGGLLTADLDGPTLPPAGTPNYVMNFGTNRLNVWKFSVDWNNSANSTLTGPTVLTTAAFNRGQTGVRWYEVRVNSGTPSLYQQGTFTNGSGTGDGLYRWMGSAAMDKAGNIALGYSVSSGGIRPSVRFTGRGPGDALGTMGAEFTIQNGTGSQTTGLSRWGDYSSMSVDPDDDCTFWFTNEYLKTNGTWNWSTRIGSFKLNNCQ